MLKKTVGIGALEGLGVETAFLALPALLTVALRSARDEATFGDGAGHSLLLASAGVVTAIPLLFFGAAAPRVPLTTLGVLQYVTPTLQFLVGVAVRHEPLPPERHPVGAARCASPVRRRRRSRGVRRNACAAPRAVRGARR